MLTIPAMVRVGPWTLVELSKSSEWTTCERCDTRTKEVWTCTVDPAAVQLLKQLDGRLEWRVGSVCGPTLLEVSEEVWAKRTAGTTRQLRLLEKAETLIAEAADHDLELPDVIFERRDLLVRGEASEKQLRHLGLVVGSWMRKLEVLARGAG